MPPQEILLPIGGSTITMGAFVREVLMGRFDMAGKVGRVVVDTGTAFMWTRVAGSSSSKEEEEKE